MHVWMFGFVALTISIYALVDTGKLPELINDLLFQLCWCGTGNQETNIYIHIYMCVCVQAHLVAIAAGRAGVLSWFLLYFHNETENWTVG